MGCGIGLLWADEELEGWPENKKIRLIVTVVAMRRPGGQTLEKSKEYISSCAWVRKMWTDWCWAGAGT